MGSVTTYGYDDQGQLTSVTDALSNLTAYSYDADANLTAITDANGHTTTYEYDLLKRKTKRTLPLGQAETFGYDARGNVISHAGFTGKTTTMTYDAINRLLGRFPDATLGEPAETYAYNPTGARASMTDASGTTNYTYDLRNRMLTKAAPAGTLTYTYDASGNMASIRSSNPNGTSVDYAWDAANQLTSVTDNRIPGGLTTTAYAVTGRPSLVTQPSGVTATYGYDTMTGLTSLAWSKGTPFARWNSTYNARGQRLTAIEFGGRQVAYVPRPHQSCSENQVAMVSDRRAGEGQQARRRQLRARVAPEKRATFASSTRRATLEHGARRGRQWPEHPTDRVGVIGEQLKGVLLSRRVRGRRAHQRSV